MAIFDMAHSPNTPIETVTAIPYAVVPTSVNAECWEILHNIPFGANNQNRW